MPISRIGTAKLVQAERKNKKNEVFLFYLIVFWNNRNLHHQKPMRGLLRTTSIGLMSSGNSSRICHFS